MLFVPHLLPQNHIMPKAVKIPMLSYNIMIFFSLCLIVFDAHLSLSFCLHCCFSLSRFGKKKEEKKEAKAALQRQKTDILSDHELERMKDERERWGAFWKRDDYDFFVF